jgi:hypothetical protein
MSIGYRAQYAETPKGMQARKYVNAPERAFGFVRKAYRNTMGPPTSTSRSLNEDRWDTGVANQGATSYCGLSMRRGFEL